MKRNTVVDILKAVGIILMLLGHSGFAYTNWIYQFHMALFFLVAGYCFSDKYIKNQQGLIRLIKSRIKSLYIPCFLFNSFIVLFHNFFLKCHIIGGNIYYLKDFIVGIIKCLLFSGGENLSGAMWFLRTMFFATLLFAIINFLCQKYSKYPELSRWVIYVWLLFFGWIGSNFPGGKYFNIFTVLILFQIGNVFRNKKISINLNVRNSFLCILFGFIFVTISLFFTDTNISLASNRIMNPIYFLFCSCSGALFCLGLSNLFNVTVLQKPLEYIGKNTLPIVMWHFLAMKVVTLLQIMIYKEDISMLSAHPFLHSGILWCILYSIVGIGLPLLLNKSYQFLHLHFDKEAVHS